MGDDSSLIHRFLPKPTNFPYLVARVPTVIFWARSRSFVLIYDCHRRRGYWSN